MMSTISTLYWLTRFGVCLQTVALTFNGAPDNDGNTDKVLDALKAAGVKATFFVHGFASCHIWEPPCSTTLARIKAEGHDIGGHTLEGSVVPALTDARVHEAFSHLNILVNHVIGPQVMSVSVHVRFTKSFQGMVFVFAVIVCHAGFANFMNVAVICATLYDNFCQQQLLLTTLQGMAPHTDRMLQTVV